MDRRRFMQIAGAMGATALLRGSHVWASTVEWTERRDLFPEGVASGDPQDTSVILWTRQPHARGSAASRLLVEVAEDREFRRVVASTWTPILETSDWTARVLVGRLRPATEYWYRFSDEQGRGSRIGRTLTAPDASDPRSVRFAFVSCQDLNTGAIHAYRRMIHEDERAAPDERIQFVLHLGDFIYEQIWYPEDLPAT